MRNVLTCLLISILGVIPIALDAQTSPAYVIAPIPKLGYLTSAGRISTGYLLCTYTAGTTTTKSSFSDSTGTANTNPVTLDAAGRANVWIDATGWKFSLFAPGTLSSCASPGGSPVWTVDHIQDAGLVALAGGVIGGSGSAGNCAFWASTSILDTTGKPCGTITGGGTALSIPRMASTTAIESSNMTEDGPASSGVLKINEKVLVDGTSSDQPLGSMVVLGAAVIANSATNAVTFSMAPFGGGGGYVQVSSGHTGSASTVPMQLGFDGYDGSNAFKAAIVLTSATTGGTIDIPNLMVTGAATGKKVVCVDTATGRLYASTSDTQCLN